MIDLSSRTQFSTAYHDRNDELVEGLAGLNIEYWHTVINHMQSKHALFYYTTLPYYLPLYSFQESLDFTTILPSIRPLNSRTNINSHNTSRLLNRHSNILIM